MKHTIDDLKIRNNRFSLKEIIILILIFLALGFSYYIIRRSNQNASIMLYVMILAAFGIWIEQLRLNIQEIKQKLQNSYETIDKKDKYIELLEEEINKYKGRW